MGRRWGKTLLGGSISLAAASQGAQCAWIVPAYRNGRTLWRWADRVTAPLRLAGRATSNKTERLIEFDNGGFLGIYSADNPDSIRGEAFHLVVLDEVARITEEAWTDAIHPTLADNDGDAFLISTPKGINWFHNEFIRGKDDGKYQASWTAPSNANPNPQIKRAFELARKRMPERTFRQEWLAEFLEDGAFFQKVSEACIIEHPDKPENHVGHYLVAGLDWALSEDYTVLTVACRDCNRVVDWDRFNQIDFTYQRIRVIDRLKQWGAAVLPERNSIGQPNIELLRSEVQVLTGHDNLPGWITSATTKPIIIQGLAAALEHHGFLAPLEYADELRSYQVETMVTYLKFNAPAGQHDDRVISLALTWQAMSRLGVFFA